MRKPVLAGLTFSLLLFGILVTLLLPPRASRVTRANYERIEEGMSRAEVEEILGGPPGDYRTRPTRRRPVSLKQISLLAEEPVEYRQWEGGEGIVEVGFDPTDAACSKWFTPTEVEGGLLDLLRWRLSRRWRQLWGR
jgi:hypothetical protein